jgi:hypothetical protein
VVVFRLLRAFPAGFLPDFLLPALLADFFADGLAAFLRAAVVPVPVLVADFLLAFFVAFFLTEFFAADFFVDFFAVLLDAAGFLRAAVFFFDAFFVEDFFVLILCFLPAAFLLAVDFLDAVAFLPPPARLCFLLVAFFAGMFHSCRSEKNAELYIGCPNMEAQNAGVFPAQSCASTVPGAGWSGSGPRQPAVEACLRRERITRREKITCSVILLQVRLPEKTDCSEGTCRYSMDR